MKKTLISWLDESITVTGNGRYRHRLLKEDSSSRATAIAAMKPVIDQAHDDARRHLRKMRGVTLDPLGVRPSGDPADGYPGQLKITALKGYFGETLAAIIAENLSPLGEDGWKVPAFLFRFHRAAFNELERAKQGRRAVKDVPGRLGDDCLAFKIDETGHICRSLVCEAKCTHAHRSKMIADACNNISEQTLVPVSTWEIVEVLHDRDDEDSKRWVASLQALNDGPARHYERCDLVCYICGKAPKRRRAWMSRTRPHKNYHAKRRFEAIEIQLSDVNDLITALYR